MWRVGFHPSQHRHKQTDLSIAQGADGAQPGFPCHQAFLQHRLLLEVVKFRMQGSGLRVRSSMLLTLAFPRGSNLLDIRWARANPNPSRMGFCLDAEALEDRRAEGEKSKPGLCKRQVKLPSSGIILKKNSFPATTLLQKSCPFSHLSGGACRGS